MPKPTIDFLVYIRDEVTCNIEFRDGAMGKVVEWLATLPQVQQDYFDTYSICPFDHTHD